MSGTKGLLLNPVALQSEWDSVNPILGNGQIGFQVVKDNSGSVTSASMKVGDGQTQWSDLPFLGGNSYPFTDAVNNPIGDHEVGDVLFGESLSNILYKMLTIYLDPTITQLSVSGVSEIVYEIGYEISGSFSFSWGTTNNLNLKDNSGIFDQSEQAFVGPGSIDIKNTTSVVVPLVAPYKKSQPGTMEMSLSALNTKDEATNSVSTFLHWYSRIRYGQLPVASISSQADVETLQNNVLARDIKGDYNFQAGYTYIAVPEFFGDGNYQVVGYDFADINPSNNKDKGLEYAMARQDHSSIEPTAPGTIDFNNGDTTFKYIILRSANYYGGDTKLRIE